MKTFSSLLLFAGALLLPATPHASEKLDRFLAEYCFDCHDDLTQEADRRMDDLFFDFGDDHLMATRWKEVVDQLKLGDMPPKKKDQPSDELRQEVIDLIDEQLDQFYSLQRNAGSTEILAFLTGEEYVYRLLDLFQLEEGYPVEPLMEMIPNVATEFEGFSHIRSAQQFTPYMLKSFQDVFEKVWNDAIAISLQKPESSEVRFDSTDFRHSNGRFQHTLNLDEDLYMESYTNRYVAAAKSNGTGMAFLKDYVAPRSGFYEITVEVESLFGRSPRYPEIEALWKTGTPMELEIGASWRESIKKPAPNTTDNGVVRERRYIEEGPGIYTATLWLEEGMTPYFGWANAPERTAFDRFLNSARFESYHPDPLATKLFERREEILEKRRASTVTQQDKRAGTYTRYEILKYVYDGPKLRTHSVTVNGPLLASWPREGVKRLFGKDGIPESVSDSPAVLKSFAQRALGTSGVDPALLSELQSIFDETIESGGTKIDAYRLAVKGLVMSPDFIFLEADEEGKKPANETSRKLSRLLWRSIPDEEMLELAGHESATPSDSLPQRLDHMLDDPRSERFLHDFLEGWLHLKDLGAMSPDKVKFYSYYRDELNPLMKAELRHRLGHVIRENLPIFELLSADYTFANDRLAQYYGVTEHEGDHFRRLNFSPESKRRGLLTSAAVLTVTANGVDTSPVLRGVWMLENILGTPTNPPPEDVPIIEPDTRGATTIRHLLQKHREIQSCAACHEKIDPLGFAMEEFDAIGQYRTHYSNGAPIDTKGEYRGRTFASTLDVQDYLLSDKELFAHCFLEKLLLFTLRRELSIYDQGEVAAIFAQWEQEDYRAKDLIRIIVESPLF